MSRTTAFDSAEVMYRAEELINAAANRYRITVQVAHRAQRHHAQKFDHLEEAELKPTIRAILEMSDELTQAEILGD